MPASSQLDDFLARILAIVSSLPEVTADLEVHIHAVPPRSGGGDLTPAQVATFTEITTQLDQVTPAMLRIRDLIDALAGPAAPPPPNDSDVPVITLVGGDMDLSHGGSWTDPGFSATDATDGDLTASVMVTGGVGGGATVEPFAEVGTKTTLSYNVSNSAGKAAVTATRTVTIT